MTADTAHGPCVGHVWGTRLALATVAVVLHCAAMASEPVESVNQGKHRELPVDVLLRRAKPLPAHDEMVIDDLTEEEGAAFLAALEE